MEQKSKVMGEVDAKLKAMMKKAEDKIIELLQTNEGMRRVVAESLAKVLTDANFLAMTQKTPNDFTQGLTNVICVNAILLMSRKLNEIIQQEADDAAKH